MMRLSVLFLMIFGLGALPARAQSDGWKELFNDKDLTGWEHVGPGGFTVEDGLAKPHGGMGLLWWTGEKVGDSVIRVVFKTEKKDSNYYHRDRVYGSFERTVELPAHVDAGKIQAIFRDGVLHVTLPKTEEAKPKEIKVSVD